eukprot:4508703-Prymnesium_polylepis.1
MCIRDRSHNALTFSLRRGTQQERRASRCGRAAPRAPAAATKVQGVTTGPAPARLYKRDAPQGYVAQI